MASLCPKRVLLYPLLMEMIQDLHPAFLSLRCLKLVLVISLGDLRVAADWLS